VTLADVASAAFDSRSGAIECEVWGLQWWCTTRGRSESELRDWRLESQTAIKTGDMPPRPS
jgi:hypothetical protein